MLNSLSQKNDSRSTDSRPTFVPSKAVRIYEKFVSRAKECGSIWKVNWNEGSIEDKHVRRLFNDALKNRAMSEGIYYSWMIALDYEKQLTIEDLPGINVDMMQPRAPKKKKNEDKEVYDVKLDAYKILYAEYERAYAKLPAQFMEKSRALFILICGQLGPEVIALMKQSNVGREAMDNMDPMKLIRALRRAASGTNDGGDCYVRANAAYSTLIDKRVTQLPDEPLHIYSERYSSAALEYTTSFQDLRAMERIELVKKRDEHQGPLPYDMKAAEKAHLTPIESEFNIAHYFVYGLDQFRDHHVEVQVVSEMRAMFAKGAGLRNHQLEAYKRGFDSDHEAYKIKHVHDFISRLIIQRKACNTDPDRARLESMLALGKNYRSQEHKDMLEGTMGAFAAIGQSFRSNGDSRKRKNNFKRERHVEVQDDGDSEDSTSEEEEPAKQKRKIKKGTSDLKTKDPPPPKCGHATPAEKKVTAGVLASVLKVELCEKGVGLATARNPISPSS